MTMARAGLSVILLKRYRKYFIFAIFLFMLQAVILYNVLDLNSKSQNGANRVNHKVAKKVSIIV